MDSVGVGGQAVDCVSVWGGIVDCVGDWGKGMVVFLVWISFYGDGGAMVVVMVIVMDVVGK